MPSHTDSVLWRSLLFILPLRLSAQSLTKRSSFVSMPARQGFPSPDSLKEIACSATSSPGERRATARTDEAEDCHFGFTTGARESPDLLRSINSQSRGAANHSPTTHGRHTCFVWIRRTASSLPMSDIHQPPARSAPIDLPIDFRVSLSTSCQLVIFQSHLSFLNELLQPCAGCNRECLGNEHV